MTVGPKRPNTAAAQAPWHERNGHPLADILCTPSQLGIPVTDLTEDEVMRDLDTLAEWLASPGPTSDR